MLRWQLAIWTLVSEEALKQESLKLWHLTGLGLTRLLLGSILRSVPGFILSVSPVGFLQFLPVLLRSVFRSLR